MAANPPPSKFFADISSKDAFVNPLEQMAGQARIADETGKTTPTAAHARRSNYLCPACLNQQSPIFSDPNGRALFCQANPQEHRWQDMSDFLALNPKMVQVKPQARQVQGNEVLLQFPIDQQVLGRLRSRFGAQLEATAEAVMMSLLDDEAYIVVGNVAKMISDNIGKQVKSGQSLMGEISTMRKTISDLTTEVGQYRLINPGGNPAALPGMPSMTGVTVTSVMVDLGSNYLKAMNKAVFNQMNLPLWLNTQVRHALENDWF